MRRLPSVVRLLAMTGCYLAIPPACASQERAQPPSLTTEQWRQDVAYFARELEQRHKNLLHSVTRADFARAVGRLDSAIPSLAPHQIALRLKQIAALVGDGHTGVHIPPWFTLYPLAVYWFGSELRITAATPEHRHALGARVVGIGDLGIEEVQARIATCFPSAANENPWFVLSASPAFVNRPEVLHGLGIVPALGPAPFQLEDEGGQRFTVEIAPIAAPAAASGTLVIPGLVPAAKTQPLFRQRPGEQFWFIALPDSETVYVSWRSYRGLGENARRLFQLLKRTTATRLVIDMRQNGGGDFFQGRRHMIEPVKRSPFNAKGRLFVIVGRRTYSAAMVNAIDFRKETNAILVGEPIGERPNSYSENDEMTLPNSRLVVSYSTRYYKFLEEDVEAVLPDVRIDPAWPDFREGRDPVLEWILRQGR